MKKIFLAIALTLGLTAFSQNETSFNYKAKFEGVSDATKAAPIITSLKMVFKTIATFNEATSTLEFSSKMSISQTVFNNMMSGEGFQVASFERQEVKAVAPPEIKKVALDTSSKSTASVVKKDAPSAQKAPLKSGK